MKMVICVKDILDPVMPAKLFSIDPNAKRAISPADMKPVISDYDESALEAALQIKDSIDSTITVISLGNESAKNTLKNCIAKGADSGVLLSDPLFDDSDSFATASILAEAIKKLGDFDLIFCGRQEGDWDAGQVGSGIAELLDIPSITIVGNIEVKDRKVVVERIISDGSEFIEVSLPTLLTVSSEIGEPRYPSFRRVREARKMKIPTWNAQDISPTEPLNKMISLFVPVREHECELITGDTAEEAGINLAIKLKEVKAL